MLDYDGEARLLPAKRDPWGLTANYHWPLNAGFIRLERDGTVKGLSYVKSWRRA